MNTNKISIYCYLFALIVLYCTKYIYEVNINIHIHMWGPYINAFIQLTLTDFVIAALLLTLLLLFSHSYFVVICECGVIDCLQQFSLCRVYLMKRVFIVDWRMAA